MRINTLNQDFFDTKPPTSGPFYLSGKEISDKIPLARDVFLSQIWQ